MEAFLARRGLNLTSLSRGVSFSNSSHKSHFRWLSSTTASAPTSNSGDCTSDISRTPARRKHVLKHQPLSVLSTRTLLRSLLIASISSRRYLLGPALSILSFISRQKPTSLLSVERNPLLRRALKASFYDQFCAGENEKEVKQLAAELRGAGIRGFILTCAKETTHEHGGGSSTTFVEAESANEDVKHDTAVAAWRQGTIDTVELLDAGDILAMKLTGAGSRVTDAFSAGQLPSQQMMDTLREIAQMCKQRRIQIIVDAESQHFQSGIARTSLELMREYNTDGYVVVYTTYQAYLKSMPSMLAAHLEEASKSGFTMGLKLVRGAYMASDDRSLIHDTKKDTDEAYNRVALGALQRQIGDFSEKGPKPWPSVSLFLASHNRESVMAAQRMHVERTSKGVPTVPVAFGQLHGMSDHLSLSLLHERGEGQASPDVFKCSTWGSVGECLAYLLRRAIENRDAVGRTSSELHALSSELRRRIRFALLGQS